MKLMTLIILMSMSQINKNHTTIHTSITINFTSCLQSSTAKKHMPNPFSEKKPQYRGVEIIKLRFIN